MKKIYMFLFATLLFAGSVQAQTLEELKAQKADLAAKAAEAQALADGFNGEIGGIQKQIDILTGWTRGLSGTVGFDFSKSKNWAASPNKDASSIGLGIGIAAFAHNIKEKTLWRNNLGIQKAWQDVDVAEEFDAEGNIIEDDIFDNGTVDIVNLSSLYGYRIHPKFALTGLGELNTSIEKFMKPGTVDIGIGGTWTPSNNLVVVFHPLNYNYTRSGDGVSEGTSLGSLGLKVRADYNNKYNLAGKDFTFGSTFTAYQPYSSDKLAVTRDDGTVVQAKLFNYTWVNTIGFEILNGIGVGVGFGFRNSEVESADVQSYYNIGLNYGISY